MSRSVTVTEISAPDLAAFRAIVRTYPNDRVGARAVLSAGIAALGKPKASDATTTETVEVEVADDVAEVETLEKAPKKAAKKRTKKKAPKKAD